MHNTTALNLFEIAQTSTMRSYGTLLDLLFKATDKMFLRNMNGKKTASAAASGNKKYSVINCQFSMHYYLSDEISWNNFLKNISICFLIGKSLSLIKFYE